MADPASNKEIATITCGYCGLENPGQSPACSGCGTSLVDAAASFENEPKPKSTVLAVSLALVLGPIGLFYVRAWWSAFILIFFYVLLVISHNADIWATLVIRILCAIWAYRLVINLNQAPDNRDCARLLDEAARLETTDRFKAIAVYEQIIQLYPKTSASEEAARNIKTLKHGQ